MPSLKAKVAKLSAAKSGGSQSREADLMLVSLLGRRDALYWPWRTGECNQWEVEKARRRYKDGSHGITFRAQGRSDWKASHYLRNQLIDSGVVTANYKNGQVSSLFLTDQGEADARAMVGSRLMVAWQVADVMRAALETFDGRLIGPFKWVSEVALFGSVDSVKKSYSPDDFYDYMEQLLPLVIVGCVRVQSDTLGALYYAWQEGAPIPPPVESQREPSRDFEVAYIAAFNSESSVLSKIVCNDGGITIPLTRTGGQFIKGTAKNE